MSGWLDPAADGADALALRLLRLAVLRGDLPAAAFDASAPLAELERVLAAGTIGPERLVELIRELQAQPLAGETIAGSDRTDEIESGWFEGLRFLSGDDLPESLGRYQIRREIARGGMGVVLEAYDPGVGRSVAIKVIGTAETARSLRRFEREGQLGASLDHPHIVQLYELSCDAACTYLVMEYIDGPTLAEAFRDLDESTRVRLAVQVAEALAHAHERGVIHRDIKPSNILLLEPDHAVVGDFGLARRVDDAEALTVAGAAVGTLYYMSPEQLLAERDRVDERADVWSLGVMLYEIFCGGRLPFVGPSRTAVMNAILFEDPPSPRTYVPMSRDLEAIILTALERDPERRYPNAAAMAADLAAYRDGEPVSVRPPGPMRRMGRWVSRHPWAPAFAASVVLLILQLQLVFGAEGRHLDRQLGAMEMAMATADWSRVVTLAEYQQEVAPSRKIGALLVDARGLLNADLARKKREEEDRVYSNRLTEASRLIESTRPVFYLYGPELPAHMGTIYGEVRALGKLAQTRRHKDDPLLHRLIGIGWLMIDWPERAERHLARSLELNPHDVEARAEKGKLHIWNAVRAYFNGDIDRVASQNDSARRTRALLPYEDAVETDLQDVYDHLAAGKLFRAGQICRLRLLEHDSKVGSEYFHLVLGALASDAPGRDKSFADANRVRRHFPWLLAGWAQTKRLVQGDLRAALPLSEQSLGLNPYSWHARRVRAYALWYAGLVGLANKEFGEVLRLSPPKAERLACLKSRVQACNDTMPVEQLHATLRAIAKDEPGWPYISLYNAIAANRCGDTQGAAISLVITAIQPVIDKGSLECAVRACLRLGWYHRAWLLLSGASFDGNRGRRIEAQLRARLGDYRQATKILSHGLARDEHRPRVVERQRLARILAERGDHDRAFQALFDVKDQLPAGALHQLAQSKSKRLTMQEAVELSQRAEERAKGDHVLTARVLWHRAELLTAQFGRRAAVAALSRRSYEMWPRPRPAFDCLIEVATSDDPATSSDAIIGRIEDLNQRAWAIEYAQALECIQVGRHGANDAQRSHALAMLKSHRLIRAGVVWHYAKALHATNRTEVLRHLRIAATRRPACKSAWYFVGLAREARGELKEALRAYGIAMGSVGSAHVARIRFARSMRLTCSPRKCAAVLRTWPDKHFLRESRAHLIVGSGAEAAGLALLDQIRSPPRARVRALLSATRIRLDSRMLTDAELGELESAVQLQRFRGDLYAMIGYVRLVRRQYRLASHALTLAVGLGKHEVVSQLGWALHRQGDSKKAIRVLSVGIERGYRVGLSLLLLGRVKQLTWRSTYGLNELLEAVNYLPSVRVDGVTPSRSSEGARIEAALALSRGGFAQRVRALAILREMGRAPARILARVRRAESRIWRLMIPAH